MNKYLKNMMADPSIKACGYFRGCVDGNIDAFKEKTELERLLSEGTKWQNMGLYTDTEMEGEGIKKMLDDCRRGAFNVIIVKSIDRISRDARFFCRFINEVFEAKVDVFFINIDAFAAREPWLSLFKSMCEVGKKIWKD